MRRDHQKLRKSTP